MHSSFASCSLNNFQLYKPLGHHQGPFKACSCQLLESCCLNSNLATLKDALGETELGSHQSETNHDSTKLQIAIFCGEKYDRFANFLDFFASAADNQVIGLRKQLSLPTLSCFVIGSGQIPAIKSTLTFGFGFKIYCFSFNSAALNS